jgi:hypothetical protein
VKTSHRWLLYTLLRLGLFAGVFAALMALGQLWWVSAIFAMLISFAVSYLFFRDTRDALAADLQQRRTRGDVDPDADAENAANDEATR